MRLLRERQLQVSGSDALQWDVFKRGVRARSTVVFASPFLSYWIECRGIDDPREAMRACRHVVRTFEIRPRPT